MSERTTVDRRLSPLTDWFRLMGADEKRACFSQRGVASAVSKLASVPVDDSSKSKDHAICCREGSFGRKSRSSFFSDTEQMLEETWM
ncbi:hypothetical protein BaRGS_00032680 [Batillaria attramentaria]|uniref:Uncharacterized protein n=1 Tax=Batillaria attramentaria TaxID=370345 RepID=A0ABD0JMX8_9CAEN